MFDTLELGWKLEGREANRNEKWEDGLYTYFYSLHTVSSVRSKILVIYWLKKQPFSILMTYTFSPLLSLLGLGSFVLGPQLTMPRKEVIPSSGLME